MENFDYARFEDQGFRYGEFEFIYLLNFSRFSVLIGIKRNQRIGKSRYLKHQVPAVFFLLYTSKF